MKTSQTALNLLGTSYLTLALKRGDVCADTLNYIS